MDIRILESEIEYFKCLPFAFTTEFLNDLEIILQDIFRSHRIHPKIQSFLLESFKKNMFIFNNFVLRNILKFPASFKLERKLSDKVIQVDIRSSIEEIMEKQLRLISLQEKLQITKSNYNYQLNRNNGYKKLLENGSSYKELCEGAKEIKNFFKTTNSLYERYKSGISKRNNEFDKLMEYKNIKSEYYRNERDTLVKMASFDSLEALNQQLNN